MARIPIDDADTTIDGCPLASGVGVDLANNVEDVVDVALKRHAITYYPGLSTATGVTPPDGDSDLTGPTVSVLNVSASEPEAIGLRVSTPPTTPLALCLGDWPMSARARSIRAIVNCATEEADVDMLLVVSFNGQLFPDPSALLVDDEGRVEWAQAITATDAFRRVKTLSPSATEDSKPVALEVGIGSGTSVDYGKHGDPDDITANATLYLFILSRQGDEDTTTDLDVTSIRDSGRRIICDSRFSDWGVNPGPLHRWIKFNAGALDLQDSALGNQPLWRGVLQVRPDNISKPLDAQTDTAFVIHPPVTFGAPYETDTGLLAEVWKCGVASIRSIVIEEFGP